VGPMPKKKTILYCIFSLDKNVDGLVAYYRAIILEHHDILHTVGLLSAVFICDSALLELCVYICIFGQCKLLCVI
jgi:hypothetical protein